VPSVIHNYTFLAGLPFRLGLGRLLTEIRGHRASLLQYWSGAKQKWTVVRGHYFKRNNGHMRHLIRYQESDVQCCIGEKL